MGQSPLSSGFLLEGLGKICFLSAVSKLVYCDSRVTGGDGGGGRSELVFGKYLPENRAKVEEQRSGRETSGNTAS